jgi:hypothetical protein
MVTLASTGLASTFSTLKSEECLKYILSKKYNPPACKDNDNKAHIITRLKFFISITSPLI